MKLFVLPVAFMLFCIAANAQSSVASASASSDAEGISVDWSIGEVANITAAFIVTGDIAKDEQAPAVYPIPFEHDFFINQVEPAAGIDFTLSDASGKSVRATFTVEGSVYRVHGSDLASGLYVLVIKQQNSSISHVFKIVKK